MEPRVMAMVYNLIAQAHVGAAEQFFLEAKFGTCNGAMEDGARYAYRANEALRVMERRL